MNCFSAAPSSPSRVCAPRPQLRFCKESNDLLYPKVDNSSGTTKLVYACRNCAYQARWQGEGGSVASWRGGAAVLAAVRPASGMSFSNVVAGGR